MIDPETRLIAELKEHPLSSIVPDMRLDEWRALLDDVTKHEVITPLDVLEDGTILDGRHRYRAACELGLVRVPVRTVYLNGTGAEEYMIKAALLRRHLSDDQRAVLALEWQKRESERVVGKANSDRRKNRSDTVSDRSEKRDTRAEAARLFTVPERKVRDAAKVKKQSPKLYKAIGAGKMTLRDAKKELHRRERNRKLRSAKKDELTIRDSHVLVGDMRDVGRSVADNSIDLIFTDPPYHDEHLDLYDHLASLASRVLKPGRYLLTYAGKMFLPEVLSILGASLKYMWMFCIFQPDSNTRFQKFHVYGAWRPVLVYAKPGELQQPTWIPDALSSKRDKQHHEWGQGIGPVLKWMESFSQPGDWILDPFCGGGTVPVAAKMLGRRYMAFDSDADSVAATIQRLQSVA